MDRLIFLLLEVRTLKSSDVVKLVKYSGSLYFANAAFFETQMLEIIAKNKDQLQYIIVDVGALNQIDAMWRSSAI